MIEKIEILDYNSFQTIYVKSDKETIGKIAAFVTELNNQQIKIKKDESSIKP